MPELTPVEARKLLIDWANHDIRCPLMRTSSFNRYYDQVRELWPETIPRLRKPIQSAEEIYFKIPDFLIVDHYWMNVEWEAGARGTIPEFLHKHFLDGDFAWLFVRQDTSNGKFA